jgi:hypothetical protein
MKNIHQFADGYVEENLALYDFEYEAENGIDGSNSSNSSDSGAKWTFIVVHRWQLSPAEVNQNLLEIEEIMAPVLPTPLPKKQRKYNMTEVHRKHLQENWRNQAASNSVGGFQRMVADIIQVLFLYMECNHNQNEKATRSELSQYRLKESLSEKWNQILLLVLICIWLTKWFMCSGKYVGMRVEENTPLFCEIIDE